MLAAYITDLQGNHLALIKRIPAPDGGNQTTAGVDLNGARVASVRIAAWDETAIRAIQARAGSRMLKVYYRPPGVEHAKLVVNAVANRPVASMGGRVVTVSAVDATGRGKRAFAAVLGKPGGDDGVTIDGRGIEAVWAAQVSIAGSVGAPTPGVVALGGRHGATHSPKAAISDGQSFQDYIDTLSDATDGPDWDLRPLDTFRGEAPEGLSASDWTVLKASSPASTFYSQLHTYDRKGNDLRDLVHFGFGAGPDNLADLEVEVAGDQTTNVAIVGITGGSKTTPTTGSALDMVSLSEVGLYCSLTNLNVDAGVGDLQELATATAQTQIDVYRYAPVFLTLTVKKDELARFYPFHNFEHGDTITVSGESGAVLIPYRGDWVKSVPARVSAITLTEDAQGRVQQGITALTDYGSDTTTVSG